MKQFYEKYPDYIHYIPDFTSPGPVQMLVKMGNCIGLPLKQRISEIATLQERLASINGIMFLFDEVSLDYSDSFKKLEKLRDIYMATGVPICICGVHRLYKMLYDSRNYDKYCSIITRLDTFFHCIPVLISCEAICYQLLRLPVCFLFYMSILT